MKLILLIGLLIGTVFGFGYFLIAIIGAAIPIALGLVGLTLLVGYSLSQ